MRALGQHVQPIVQREFPRATVDTTGKRAVLVEFHQPVFGVDPSVDLVVCLTRRERRGFWIPNTRKAEGWDAADPEAHSSMMTAEPKALRVFRARIVRLAKAAVNNDGDSRVLIPWNLSALALTYITTAEPKLSVALADFFDAAADDVERRLTPDPAHVSSPISLPPGVDQPRAAGRLRFFAARIREAVGNSAARDAALTALVQVFGQQLPDAPRSAKQRIAEDLKGGGRTGAASAAFGAFPRMTSSDGRA
jgi:hypothetical protein